MFVGCAGWVGRIVVASRIGSVVRQLDADPPLRPVNSDSELGQINAEHTEEREAFGAGKAVRPHCGSWHGETDSRDGWPQLMAARTIWMQPESCIAFRDEHT